MDPVEELLKETRRHLSAGRSAKADETLDEAIALAAAEPPSVERAFAFGRFGAGFLPAIARLPTLTRAVEIAWATEDGATTCFWVEHLVNDALEAGRPEAALPDVARLLAEPWLSAWERTRAVGWERKLTRAAAKAEKAAQPKPTKVRPVAPAPTPRGKAGGSKPAGNVARWLTRTRAAVRALARAEEVDPDALAEVLGQLEGLARDLRALGGDRGAHVLDDPEDVEDPQKRLVVASGESDARARVEGLEAIDEGTPFAEVQALLEPAEW
ncbi:MAG: hypothetical protein Q8P18_10660 [Pseudomonadota bacterium]|nr:hypothetical protein [Pseudomonadota bacterium]